MTIASSPLAYFGGRFVPQEEVRLPINDAGFVLGATVTDLCRTVKQKLYLWPDHLARFRRSCRAARIYPPVPEDEISQIAEELVAQNVQFISPGEDLALVLIATPGPIGYYTGKNYGPGAVEPTFLLHTFPLPFARYRSLFREGAHLVIPSTRHVPAECVDPRIKQRSRMHWWLAQQEVQQIDPHATALLLDQTGHVTETAAANFLLLREEVVYSPPSSSVLEGISLKVVKELCARLNIPFRETALTVYDCMNADEAMLCSTPYCLAGVGRINTKLLPWPGPIFQKLLQAWSKDLGLDIQAQIINGC